MYKRQVHNKADPSKLGTENVGPAGVPSFDDTGGMSSGTTGESEQDPGGGGWDSDAGDVARAALSFNPQGVETIGGQVYPSGILDRSSTQMDPQVQSSFDPPGLLSWLEPNTPAGWLSYPAMGLKYGTPIGLGLTALDMMWGSNKGKVGTLSLIHI